MAELRLSVDQRQALIKLDSWSIEEAGFYFLDCDWTNKYEQISSDFFKKSVSIQEAIVDDFRSDRRLYKKYQLSLEDIILAVTTKVSVSDLMLWVRKKWKKHFPDREYPILFNLYKQEVGFKSKEITQHRKNLKGKTQVKCEKSKIVGLTEKQKKQLDFLLSKEIRIDLLIELIYEAYQMAWCQDAKPRYKKNRELEEIFRQHLVSQDNFSIEGKYSGLSKDRMDVVLCHLVRTQQYRNLQSFKHWLKELGL